MFKDSLVRLKDEELLKEIPKEFKFNLQPYRHQLISLVWAKDRNAIGLAHEMGTGKTKIAIDWLRLKGCKKILVIGVNAILENWKQEFELNAGKEYKVVVLGGMTTEEKDRILKEDNYDVYIINYEGLCYRNKNGKENFKIKNWKQSVESIIESVIDRVLEGLKRSWDAIVIDESRSICHVESVRTRAVLYLASLTKYKVVMSGTPIVKLLTEIFPQQYVIDDGMEFGKLPKALMYKLYNVDYKPLGWTGKKIPVMGEKKGAAEYVKNKMSKWWLRFEKNECVDLPEKIYEDRYVSLEGEQLKDYVKMKQQSKLEVLVKNKTYLELQKALMRLMQICGGYLKVEDDVKEYKKNAKMDELVDLLEGELSGKKVVISAVFKAEQKGIIDMLNKLKINHVAIIGGMSPEEIKKAESDFLYNDDVKVIVLSPKVGARGINLAVADYVILYSMSYNYEEIVQLEDRVHRLPPKDLAEKLKDKKHITYIRLVAKNTVDEDVILVINRDKKTIEQLFTEMVADNKEI
jgi:SNF2 family DNA or RNA helicase